MTGAQVWLAKEAHDRLQDELTVLLRERESSSAAPAYDGRDRTDSETDQQVLADRVDRESRIRKLQELLRSPVVGQDPPDDGVAEAGMVLTVSFDGDPEPETFLLAHGAHDGYPGAETCSPDSPLGRALSGAREGETRQVELPDGRSTQVTLQRAVPYRGAE